MFEMFIILKHIDMHGYYCKNMGRQVLIQSLYQDNKEVLCFNLKTSRLEYAYSGSIGR